MFYLDFSTILIRFFFLHRPSSQTLTPVKVWLDHSYIIIFLNKRNGLIEGRHNFNLQQSFKSSNFSTNTNNFTFIKFHENRLIIDGVVNEKHALLVSSVLMGSVGWMELTLD